MPLKINFKTYRKNVQPAKGQIVAFKPGKGYYAKPNPTIVPAKPRFAPAPRPRLAEPPAPWGPDYQPGPNAPPATVPPSPAPATAAPPAPAAPAPQLPPASGPLPWNPQLPPHPLGAQTDAQYLADEAALRRQTVGDYQNYLGQLGYTNPEGVVVPGTIEVAASAERMKQEREKTLAEQAVTEQMQRAETLFSGYRGTEQARRTEPMVRALSDLAVNTPMALSEALNKARQTLTDYELGRNALLAEAADRASQRAGQAPLMEEEEVTPAPAAKPKPAAKPFKPGRYFTKRAQVKLKPGMKLAFRKGKGYYAKPKGRK